MMRNAMTSNPGQRRPVLAGLLALFMAAGPVLAQQGQAPQAPATTQTQTAATSPAPPASPASERSLQLDTGIALGQELQTETPPIAENAIQLSLERAIELALTNNLDVVLQRFERQRSRLGVLQALGIYDLRFQGNLRASDSSQETDNPLQLATQNNRGVLLELRQLLPTGGDVSVGVDNRHTEATLQNGESFGEYNSNLTFGLFQPLLRGFGRNNVERQLLLARTDSLLSLQQFEAQVNATIQAVSNAYWNLAEANLQLQVARESLNLAQELHNRNKIEVEVGTRPPLDLVQSEAAIAEREVEIIQAQTNIGNAEDSLRLLLNLPADGQYWNLPIRTTTDPAGGRITIDLPAALQTAFAERSELRTQGLNIERAQVEAAFLRNQTLPDLNLTVEYNLAGTGAGLNETFRDIRGIDFDGWSALLQFSVPVQNRAARAASTIADLTVESAETQRALVQAQITNEVRQAARNVESAAQTIEAARASREFQERNLDAERKRYENGMSTSFQITQIQEDLTQARQREVTAIINYRRAVTEFYRATGQLLDEEGIELLDPAQEINRFEFSLFR